MSYHDFEPESREGKLGKAIYVKALSGRRGFRNDQIGISDDDLWLEIFEEMGTVALQHLSDEPTPDKVT